MSLFDLLVEFGAHNPWLSRGWCYAFSQRCRIECHDRWQRHGPLYALGDIVFSLFGMSIPLILVAVILIITPVWMMD